MMLKAKPTLLFTMAGMEPDPWQQDLLEHDRDRVQLCCCRQSGKSQTAACIALKTAFLEPGSLILILSRSDRQAGELFREKLKPVYRPWQRYFPARRETERDLCLDNGSRIVSLPGKADTIVGYSSVQLALIDEAARVPDELYKVVRPMISRRQGRLLALSTPYGRKGWFYKAWSDEEVWHKVKVTADMVPALKPKFLEEERMILGEAWYAQEYECVFNDTLESVFSARDIFNAFTNSDVKPMFPESVA
jgi:hypothetical protein